MKVDFYRDAEQCSAARAVSLNIKNEHVHNLVREAARRTGKSQTSVVEEALRRYLDEIDRARDAVAGDAEVDRILTELDALRAERPELFQFDVDDLYDADTGLPA